MSLNKAECLLGNRLGLRRKNFLKDKLCSKTLSQPFLLLFGNCKLSKSYPKAVQALYIYQTTPTISQWPKAQELHMESRYREGMVRNIFNYRVCTYIRIF